jgi:hypothetical protein
MDLQNNMLIKCGIISEPVLILISKMMLHNRKLTKKKLLKIPKKSYTQNLLDILFITDKKNSIDSLIKKYGFADKAAAYRTRGYLKRAYIK